MKNIEVKITKVEKPESRLLAYVDVTLDNAVAIHNIRIIQNGDKRFIAFPSARRLNKETGEYAYYDLVHPIKSDVRKEFEDAIFTEYDKLDE